MIKHCKIVICVALLLLALGLPKQAKAQFYTAYGNALLLATGTLNVGVNIGLSSKWSVDLALLANPIKTTDFSAQVAMIQPGARYWLNEIQYGHFIGTHVFAGIYDVGDDISHTKGFTVGLGFSYGYNWLITKRLNIGVEIGGGLGYMKDTREEYIISDSKDHYRYHATRLALLPTKCGINMIFLF